MSLDSHSPAASSSKTTGKRPILGQTLLWSIRASLIAAVLLICFLAFGPAIAVVPGGDKGNHFLAFLVLSLLLDFSFPKTGPGLVKVAILIGFGAMIEFVQYFLPGREMSSMDMVADVLGILTYVLCWNRAGKLGRAICFRELLSTSQGARP